MALSLLSTPLVRCELNRAAELARAAGVKLPLIRVDTTTSIPELVRAAARAAGYVLTLWEVSLAAALPDPQYALLRMVYRSVEAFVVAPTTQSLEKAAPSLSLLIAAVAQLRGIPDPCGSTVVLPGLVPPALELSDASLERLPAPAAPAPRERSRKMGGALLGGMSAATLVLVGAAVVRQAGDQDDEKPISSW